MSIGEISKSKLPDLHTGGKKAIERMVEAYGFSTRQALCDHLGISKSTLATRYMRDSFPAEWVIQCALETGASIYWLSSGNGPMFEDGKSDVVSIPRKKLLNGKLHDSNYYMFDKAFLPDGLQDPIVIVDGDVTYIADRKFDEVTDGKWLVEIEGKTSVRELTRIPVGKVRVSGVGMAFDCGIDEIGVISKIIMDCTKI
ncbi:phage repressor protein CI [Pectobacterium carotovorum]|uniref:phage repressor protein CI n=1 Tax=Pectobacterium carotovorum TaxID=554 RepID=UPI0029D5D78C|nr:phage repressor protein CI [Pectobacterium carotovorum]MDX6913935.1 phage repressor protein CI [Pectobacterium carotovorum]